MSRSILLSLIRLSSGFRLLAGRGSYRPPLTCLTLACVTTATASLRFGASLVADTAGL